MPRRSFLSKQVREPYILLVEGINDAIVCDKLANRLRLHRIQIIDAQGEGNFYDVLHRIESNTDDFRNRIVKSIGIIADADDDPQDAFQRVCRALHRAHLSREEHELVPISGRPEPRILILPGKNKPGALETLCIRSVQDDDDPLMPCVEGFSKCVEIEWVKQLEAMQRSAASTASPRKGKKTKPLTATLDKMRVRAFLASRDYDPEIRVGEAAERGVWDLKHEAFNEIADFLTKLVEP